MTRQAGLIALVLVPLLLIVQRPTGARAAAILPTHTPTPTATPYPTSTPPATQTPYPTYTVAPSPSPIPQGVNPTNPHQYCTGLFGWCPSISGLLDAIGAAVVTWLIGGVDAIVRAVADLIAAVVRVDQWSSVAGFFGFMLKVGGGVALGLTIVGALLYQRSMLPGGNPKDGAAGLGMLSRALETAVLLGGLGWGIGQLFDLAGRLVEQTDAYSGVVAADALLSLVAVFVGDGAILNPINDVMGVVAFVVYLLIVMVKFASVAALAWLVVVSPLVMGTWPLGASLAARWLSSLASVLLWGLGWAIWLMLSTAILANWSLAPTLKPFLVVALLLFGYGVPRLVDSLVGASMAGLSGAFKAPGFLVGLGELAATRGVSLGLKKVTGGS